MKKIIQQADRETFYAASQQDWRKWLMENHESKQSIWLMCYKKNTGMPTIAWTNAVDEALCFGWIDSTRVSVGDDKFIQFFTRRKPTSVWSKINKEKVERLIRDGLMMPAGLKSIDIAKQNGSWTILDTVEALEIPKDLAKALKAHPGSKEYLSGLSKSVRKSILQWVIVAKRPETRQKRIDEIATLAAQQLKPKQFR